MYDLLLSQITRARRGKLFQSFLQRLNVKASSVIVLRSQQFPVLPRATRHHPTPIVALKTANMCIGFKFHLHWFSFQCVYICALYIVRPMLDFCVCQSLHHLFWNMVNPTPTKNTSFWSTIPTVSKCTQTMVFKCYILGSPKSRAIFDPNCSLDHHPRPL